jgi:hypothetical protein
MLSSATGSLHGVLRVDWAFIILVAVLAFLGLSHWLLQILSTLR